MLIYNFQKEFLGIDEDDLQALGFSDLNELQTESYDFADLFVRQPGHIYNFQHVHWIDFLLYADSSEETKAIIFAKNKHYKCNLSIEPMYLTDNPTEQAYVIYINNLMFISSDGIDTHTIQRSSASRPKQKAKKQKTIESKRDMVEEKSVISKAPLVSNNDVPINLEDDLKLDVPNVNVNKQQKEKELKDEFSNYVYDPNVACKELGLPLDLIEEFVQDFINQAFEFKEKLYIALKDGDMDNLKSLSHKLKGVAANLHIEDAFQTLTIINTSNDQSLIATKLDRFYKIINKLANKETEEENETEASKAISNIQDIKPIDNFKPDFEDEIKEENPIDDFKLDFKDEIQIDEAKPVDNFKPDLEDEIKEENPIDDFKLDFKDEIQDSKTENNVTKELTIQPILSHYNKDEVAQEIGLDVDMFNSLFEHFVREGKKLSIDIKKAIKEKNPKKWQEDARELKRMRDNMRITDFTAELETIMSSSSEQEIEEAINKIDTIISYISSEGV